MPMKWIGTIVIIDRTVVIANGCIHATSKSLRLITDTGEVVAPPIAAAIQ